MGARALRTGLLAAALLWAFVPAAFAPAALAPAAFAQGTSFGPSEPPVAVFTYAPANPTAGQSILFDAGRSHAPAGTIVDYMWDFTGDGHYDATGPTAAWAFPEPGAYRVTLYVVDNRDGVGRTTRTIRVGGLQAAAPPEARFTYTPERPRPGDVVVFDASASVFGDGAVLFEWDLDGDGLFEARGPVVGRRYDHDGLYPVTLRLTDGAGRIVQTTRAVQVGRGLVRVVLDSDPTDLQVTIDGVDFGRTPVTLDLAPERHQLRLKHLWRGEWETELDLRYVERLELRIVLR